MRLATLLFLTLSLSAQSPYEVAPENYQKLFEDEYFRVSKATYRPADKIKFHAHPLTATVYVYLTDSGPVRFFHAGGGGITRAPVKAGAVRFADANTESHEVENLGNLTSEFLRIEILKAGVFPKSQMRLPPEFEPTENGPIRIERIACEPQQECASPSQPGVLVSLTRGQAVLLTRPYTNTTEGLENLILVSWTGQTPAQAGYSFEPHNPRQGNSPHRRIAKKMAYGTQRVSRKFTAVARFPRIEF